MITLSTLALCLAISPSQTPDEPIAADLIAAHNRERAERKLPPLVAEPRLTEAAKVHAVDMAAHNKMTHEGSDGSTEADRVKRQKYPYFSTGENVAEGQESVDGVMKAWMTSPHHRENILGDFTEIGVARAESADGKLYWCVDFGKPFVKLEPEKAESDLAEKLNHARGDAEKDTLKVDRRLAKAARAIAQDFAAQGTLKTDEPGEKTKKAVPSPNDRIAQSGYRFSTVSLSTSSGAPNSEALIHSLMDSADQKATLLGSFSDCGVGYALADDGRPFWCIILAKPQD